MEHLTRMQVMIVSNLDDESLRSCVTEIESVGAEAIRLADVYSATAQLASPHSTRHVIVDVRSLDNHEAQFLKLAPRYFPTLVLLVPDLAGTSQHIASLGESISTVSVSAIARAIRQGDTKSAPGTDLESESSAPIRDESLAADPDSTNEAAGPGVGATRLSTDGGPEHADAGPALHEAVRMRMAEGQTAPVRRAPPRQAADSRSESSGAAHSVAAAVDASVSAEEVNALLGTDGPGDDAAQDRASHGEAT